MKVNTVVGLGATCAMTTGAYVMVSRLDDATIKMLMTVIVIVVLVVFLGGLFAFLTTYRIVPNSTPPAKRIVDAPAWDSRLHVVEPHPDTLAQQQALLPPPLPAPQQTRPPARFQVLGADMKIRDV